MKSQNKILIAFILNISFSIFELIGGAITGSVAVLSDSLHDLGDGISIGISYFLEKISRKGVDENYTYGYKRFSVLGGLITSSILAIGSVIVAYNAVIRIINPTRINHNGMIILAVFGIVLNVAAAFATSGGFSMNLKAVNLHMIEDVLGWCVVLLGGIIIKFTNLTLMDPLMSIGVAVFIFLSAIKNIKRILEILMDKVPETIEIGHIYEHLEGLNGVKGVHHLHIRSLDSINNIATVHIVTDEDCNSVKSAVKNELKNFGIYHTTVETESSSEICFDKQCNSLIAEDEHHHHHHH